MKITRIRIYQTGLPYVGGTYAWGAGNAIETAIASVVAHFAASTPPEYLQNTTDLMNYNTRSTGVGGPVVKDGKFYATNTPGLGVTPDFESLGAPVAEYAL
ncbi:hypothetical protein [Ruegeria sp. HKCCD6119]|uniref:hypothetical protein n=1 Tax=Ruegeria sp. HKCCD6119 TaxID=2683003 RepID=UPI001C0F68EA|nr:hypothetical protein [Ruegeria sp. HKCCD6119]